MMECVALGSVASVKSGFAFKSKDWKDDGVPVIKIANVKDGFVVLDGCSFVDEAVAKSAAAFELKPGDILISMTGYIGEVARVRNEGRMLLNQRVGKFNIKRGASLNGDFLFHCLRDPELKAKFVAHAYGAAQPNISPTLIEQQEIPLPPLPIQRRIAGILSAYDDLIENSQRRIKILESMARALYREWFVHFRYPGHESVPLVPSPLGDIPMGWAVKSVADSFEISGGGTPSRKEDGYWDGGAIQWFSPSDLTGASTMFMDDSSDHITALGLAQSSARLFPAMCVMLTSRATIGAIAINTREACTNQGFITCLPNKRVPLYFLFHWVYNNVPTFQRMASGATFKEISRGVFKSIDFLHPPEQLTEKFESVVAPVAGQVLALQRQVQTLRRTRDLLLPRLLSGQIDVAALDHA